MFSVLLRPPPDREDHLIAELWDCGTAGIVEEDHGIRAFFEDGCDTTGLLQRFASFAPQLRKEQSIDWAEATREAWPPLWVGERFFLTPPWCGEPTPPGRLRLPIYPGMACGTGRHPATQLALKAIEQYVRPGDRVVDVGTGSGILAAAAKLIGAGLVIGCDVDPEAIQIARQRLPTPLFAGSANAIQGGWADVVIANIDAATIEELAGELRRIRKPNSTLILTGFPDWDVPDGLEVRDTLQHEEWLCLIC